jgi:hypothetical protein
MSKKDVSHETMYTPAATVHFDIEAFDVFVASHGVTMEHYQHMPCPIGVTDVDDDRLHSDHDCSNGFLYEKVGEVTGYFSGNATVSSFEDFGIKDGSTVVYTLPRFYDKTENEVLVQPRDRFYIKDYQGSNLASQRFEHSISGVDRLNFKALKIHRLVDSAGTKYVENQDFKLENGYIRWIGKRPGFDPETQKGAVCSVRYSYLPYYYAERLMHDTRVTRQVNDVTGDISLVRMQTQVLLTREFIHDNEPNNDKSPSERDVRAPRKRSFGPR